MVLVIGGSGTDCLTLVREMSRKQESPPTFLLSNKGKGEKNGKDLWDVYLSSRGRLWKGKVLAPFSSMVFHELLVTCLDHLFAFSIVWNGALCGFERVLKRGHCCGNLCNDSCLNNVYKYVLSFEKCFIVWKFVWKLFWNCVCVWK